MVLAGWFDARLADCAQPRPLRSQLYGLEIVDPEGFDDSGGAGARVSFLCDDLDDDARDFDALVIVGSRWWSATPRVLRPGEFAVRRRAGVVTVVSDLGTATALRVERDPSHVVFATGIAASCPLGAAVAWWWANART